MKRILMLLALLVPIAALGQTTYDIYVTPGGTITGPIGGRSPAFHANSLNIGSVYIDGVRDPNFHSGTINFTAGAIASGNNMVGSELASGGTFTVTTDDLGMLFSGSWASGGLWVLVFNANESHEYTLSSQLTDAMGDSGAMELTTVTSTSVTCFFSGSEKISDMNVHLSMP